MLVDATLLGLGGAVELGHEQVQVAIGRVPEQLEDPAVHGAHDVGEEAGVEGVVGGGEGGRLTLDADVLVERALGVRAGARGSSRSTASTARSPSMVRRSR